MVKQEYSWSADQTNYNVNFLVQRCISKKNFMKIWSVIIIFLKPTSTKPQAWKLRESIMAATVAHSAIIVFWKETAFPCWRAMVRRWWQEQQVCSSTGELTNYTLVSVGSLQQSYYLAKIICLTWMSGQVSVSPALDVTSLSQYHA